MAILDPPPNNESKFNWIWRKWLGSVYNRLRFQGTAISFSGGITQTVTDDTFLTVQWNNIIYDNVGGSGLPISQIDQPVGGEFTKRLTVPGGVDLVRMSAEIFWSDPNLLGNGYYETFIGYHPEGSDDSLGGDNVAGGSFVNTAVASGSGTGIITTMVSYPVRVSKGDFFQLRQFRKGGVDVAAGAGGSYFAMEVLA